MIRHALSASLLALAAAASAQSSYHVTDLGALSGSYRVGGVNDLGQVTGASNGHPFLTGPNGISRRDLGTLGGGTGVGLGVNALGQVTGASDPGAIGGDVAFLSGPNGGALRSLGTLGGFVSTGYAVNASGQVAGGVMFSASGAYAPHGFLSGPNGGALRDLGANSVGYGVNDAGRVTGEWNGLAFLSGPDGGPLRSLGKLAGFGDGSRGLSVNASGQVAGCGTSQVRKNGVTVTYTRAFLSAPDGGALKDLGAIPSDFGALFGDQTLANGVNDAGQVVGLDRVNLGGYPSRAFLYTAASGMRDLNTMLDASGAGWTLTSATGVSNAGFVAGIGTFGGRTHAFLLAPQAVPEPAPFAALGLGALALRRRKAQTPRLLTS